MLLLLLQNAKALKAKKEEGNQAFKVSSFDSAYQLYSEALTIDPNNIKTNAKLYCNRATAGAKVRPPRATTLACYRQRRLRLLRLNRLLPPQQLNKLDQAIDDCSSAIKLDDSYIKAYLRRAQW